MDRMLKHVKLLVNYSAGVWKGDTVSLEMLDPPGWMEEAFAREIRNAGGLMLTPYVKKQRVFREFLLNASEAEMKLRGETELARMQRADVFICARCQNNSKELSDVPPERFALYDKYWRIPVYLNTANKKRGGYYRVPTAASAQAAGMSTQAYEDFFYSACLGVNWKKFSKAMVPLVKLMRRTDIVEIKSPGTDLRFSIKKIPALAGDGHFNMPDGEVETAPVRESVEGVIQYNTSSTFRGITFQNIRFVISRGRIVKASANNTQKLNEILDSDPGARYFGEFALGLHPLVNRTMDDILFDEKRNGSFHLTIGNAYPSADNGNRSGTHWDLVCVQTLECGGGTILFDGVPIRQDGRFVLPELSGLNSENLLVH